MRSSLKNHRYNSEIDSELFKIFLQLFKNHFQSIRILEQNIPLKNDYVKFFIQIRQYY